MTLYYSMVFGVLVAEMLIFCSLIVPIPFTWRRKLFAFISESPIIAKLQYGMKITFIFILILFIDSVNRVYRVQVELSAFKNADNARGAAVMGGSERMEVQARKFYSQRNMYLCGFTLFLSLILNRTYVMILDVLRLEEELKAYKGDKSGKKGSQLADAGKPGEIGRLKEELLRKDRDMENLKKQVEGMQNEYNRMGDQVTGTTAAAPRKNL
ncbi:endoplasmic reticulum protein-like protein [Sporormia fimetaria CBS 119925]|uniref:Endoplasmic reticulum transmembrane protein n=1 Tax=Sporormia fimetaria CBS 119925 TaxID=1340428 RepID=A0A6A6VNR5_9PLEO|nr:endoplasmic reticulum protein-like protein [Sporormia fimetaria CBS 119925]